MKNAYRDNEAGIALAQFFTPDNIEALQNIQNTSVELYDGDHFVAILKMGSEMQASRLNEVCGTLVQKRDWLNRTQHENGTVKVEGLEDLAYFTSAACETLKELKGASRVDLHLFMSWTGSYSFPNHADDTDVVMLVVKGKKRVMFQDQESELLGMNDCLFVPKGLEHAVTTEDDALLLSFGIYK